MTADKTTAPERTYVTWPGKGCGLAFSEPADTRTEYIRSDLCASGQVLALELRLRDWQGRAEMAGRALEAVLSGKPVQNADEIISFCKYAALTPAPQPEGQVRDRYDAILEAVDSAPADPCISSLKSDVAPTPSATTPTAQEAVPVAWMGRSGMIVDEPLRGFTPLYNHPPQPSETVADQIIGQIEDRFPNWRSYRDLLDCIDCTLHDLRALKGGA